MNTKKPNNYKNNKPVSIGPAGFSGPNQAFLDAEYLSARIKRGAVDDVISIGVVITDPAHTELDRYYSTVRLTRGHRLTPLITELTGLTNQELAQAPLYEDVMFELIARLKRWQVGKVFVWGGDKNNFQRDFDSRIITGSLKKDIVRFINSIVNIQKDVSLDVTEGLDQGLSLADLKTICGLGGHVAHNALNDAEDMLECIRVIELDKMAYDGAEAARYKHFRGEYVKNRSFSDDEEDIFFCFKSEAGSQLLAELEEKGFADNPKTKAFMDDLAFLLGEGNAHMGTFAEMMADSQGL